MRPTLTQLWVGWTAGDIILAAGQWWFGTLSAEPVWTLADRAYARGVFALAVWWFILRKPRARRVTVRIT